MRSVLLLILLLFQVSLINAQSPVLKPATLRVDMDSATKAKLYSSLDTLFLKIKNNVPLLIGSESSEVNFLKSLSRIQDTKSYSPDFYKVQLINLYPISKTEYWITIAFTGCEKGDMPVLRAVLNLIATIDNGIPSFLLPTKYLTQTWKSKIIGNITYHFKDKLNMARAKEFDRRNTMIATKLKLKPEKLQFYMCYNYQEALQLLGFGYDADSNGKTREGYGVDNNTIFSVMDNEDFSHDLFHYYSDKVRGDIEANWIVEEGMAYYWGNAYYTKSNGEMINQKELVQALKEYIKMNPTTSLLKLFRTNPKIFNHLAAEISAKSTISSLICYEVERLRGVDGLGQLIKCGKGETNYFKTLSNLININETNFDSFVMKVISQYKGN